MADRAVFLDRDGVINRKAPEGDYIINWDEFEFLPAVADAIKILNENHYKVIIVTNQRGIALGWMTLKDLNEIHERMSAELKQKGAVIDAIYYCPHEKESCSCRKPAVGMFLAAKETFPDLSFEDSFVVGDSLSDMAAGKALHCKCILIVGESSDLKTNEWYYRAGSLYDAVKKYILPH